MEECGHMATLRQDRKFKEQIVESIIVDDSLTLIIDWIQSNLYPEDVFDSQQLLEWAKNQTDYTIEDMASTAELENWALDNGFKKEK